MRVQKYYKQFTTSIFFYLLLNESIVNVNNSFLSRVCHFISVQDCLVIFECTSSVENVREQMEVSDSLVGAISTPYQNTVP